MLLNDDIMKLKSREEGKKLSEMAGSWKISDSEAKSLISDIQKG